MAVYRGEMRDWQLEEIRKKEEIRMLCMQNQYDEFLTLFGYQPLFLEAIQKFDHDQSFL